MHAMAASGPPSCVLCSGTTIHASHDHPRLRGVHSAMTTIIKHQAKIASPSEFTLPGGYVTSGPMRNRTLEPHLQNCAPTWMFCTRFRHFIKLDLDAAVRVYASASVIPGDASCISTACSALKEPTSIRLAPRAMPSVRTTCCTSTGVWALNMFWQATCSACIGVGEFWQRSRLPAGLCGTATAADRVGTAEGIGAAEGVVTRHGAVATSVAKQAGTVEGMGAAAGMGAVIGTTPLQAPVALSVCHWQPAPAQERSTCATSSSTANWLAALWLAALEGGPGGSELGGAGRREGKPFRSTGGSVPQSDSAGASFACTCSRCVWWTIICRSTWARSRERRRFALARDRRRVWR